MKVAQISVIAKISGNVNADEVIGTRVTLKKMYSSTGEVLPYVSARAIKYAIRHALKDMGFEVDPLTENPKAMETLRLNDTGDPVKFIDNDLFGYMVTLGTGKQARRRQAPIALSYLKALRDTPVKAEFAARFPRIWGKGEEENPVPFEIEVAEFIGKLNCIMYENIGVFDESELQKGDNLKGMLTSKSVKGRQVFMLDEETRKKRIKAFLQVLLTPSYVLPRRTNSLNIPEYLAALIVLSANGPLPIFQYLSFDFDKNDVCLDSLMTMLERKEILESGASFFLIDYGNRLQLSDQKILQKLSVADAINKVVDFL